jgi:hypothetical protein
MTLRNQTLTYTSVSLKSPAHLFVLRGIFNFICLRPLTLLDVVERSYEVSDILQTSPPDNSEQNKPVPIGTGLFIYPFFTLSFFGFFISFFLSCPLAMDYFFLATFFFGAAFLTVFLATFLAAGFFLAATFFFGAAFLATFFATRFFAAVFTTNFFTVFLAAGFFLVTGFFATFFFGAAFLAAGILK